MAMLNWQGWAANFLGWGGEGVATPPAAAPAASGVRRRRPRAYVEIDGELFPVDGFKQAQTVLKQARETAREVIASRPAKLAPPKVKVKLEDPKLEAMVADEIRALQKQYMDALRDDDDEEAILLLMA